MKCKLNDDERDYPTKATQATTTATIEGDLNCYSLIDISIEQNASN